LKEKKDEPDVCGDVGVKIKKNCQKQRNASNEMKKDKNIRNDNATIKQEKDEQNVPDDAIAKKQK